MTAPGPTPGPRWRWRFSYGPIRVLGGLVALLVILWLLVTLSGHQFAIVPAVDGNPGVTALPDDTNLGPGETVPDTSVPPTSVPAAPGPDPADPDPDLDDRDGTALGRPALSGSYVVVDGDNLTSIASRACLTAWRPVQAANTYITNPNFLAIGDRVAIPDAPRGICDSSGRTTLDVPNAVWSALADCATGGNWTFDGRHADGGLAISPATWKTFGGADFAPTAGEASQSEQIIVGERIAALQGAAAWPCAQAANLVT